MNVAFLLCVERGFLEAQAVMLAESIRRFGGRLAGAEVHAFQPRPDHRVAEETRERLASLDVALHEDVHNTASPQFPRTNKVYVCDWAERHLDADTLAFLDSDTVLLREPAALVEPGAWAVAVRPVDSRNVCSTGPGHRHEAYWQALYAACGVEGRPFVETAVEGERVRACWNSGLVAVRRAAGVLGRWRRDLESCLAAGLLPPARWKRGVGYPFLDQNALAVTLARDPNATRTLPPGYNYCLPKRARMREPLRTAPWSAIVHLHYHEAFSAPGALGRIDPPLDADDPRHAWLSERLPLRRVGRAAPRWPWRRRHAPA
jgi:hypothetical protein